MTAPLLAMQGVRSGWGDALVLDGVDLQLDPGESLALLGRNGMGKTTLLATLMGAARSRGGTIRFDGHDLLALPTHRRARAGIGWVPQERDIFGSLTVDENLSVVARPGPWTAQRVYTVFPRLAERRTNLGSRLSGGEQQMLAIGRALMLNPRLLLLDEPLEGLAPQVALELLEVLHGMLATGDVAIVLVEQQAHRILPLTRRAVVLERGRVAWAGPSAELAADPDRLAALLGVRAGPALAGARQR